MKPKKCKGTGYAKGHGCGRTVQAVKYGLGLSCGCYKTWLLNTPEGKQRIEKASLKAKKEVRSEKSKREKQWIEENKSIARLIQETRVIFQKYIRLRDANESCISCNSHSEMMDGGHYFKAEIYSGLIFNEMNCNSQCRKCNRFQNGNESNYRIGLVKKYGAENVQNLENLANVCRSKKYTREELNEIKTEYTLKYKQLTKQQ